ncbi:MAG: hypothetical protein ACTSSP_00325 [Candidatus Asgardarchaeia archaeon]
MVKTKKGHKLVFIKILVSDLMSSLYYGTSCQFNMGEIVVAVHLDKEWVEKWNSAAEKEGKEKWTYGAGYMTRGREFIVEGAATTEITDKEYFLAIKKLNKEIKKYMAEKAKTDRILNQLGRDVVALTKDRREKHRGTN